MATTKRYDVKDLALAPEGVRRIQWADRQMPVLAAIRERFEREPELRGAVEAWLAATQLSALDWEQRKHERLLAA
jgi:S-adenosylhomocysteine hydrolase